MTPRRTGFEASKAVLRGVIFQAPGASTYGGGIALRLEHLTIQIFVVLLCVWGPWLNNTTEYPQDGPGILHEDAKTLRRYTPKFSVCAADDKTLRR